VIGAQGRIAIHRLHRQGTIRGDERIQIARAFFVLLLLIGEPRRVAIGFGLVAALLLFISAGLAGWQSLLHYPAFGLEITKSPGLVATAVALLSSVVLFLFAAMRGHEHPGQTARAAIFAGHRWACIDRLADQYARPQSVVDCALGSWTAANLMTLPLLWWVWEIGKEVSCDSNFRVSPG
jgi:hypothetical protein